MTRPTLAFAFTAVLAVAGCDSAELDADEADASAVEVEYLGVSDDPFSGLALDFRYVGETPCPAYELFSYGTSLDPATRRIDVNVTTRSVAEGCSAVVGTVIVDPLRVDIPREGTYTLAFERLGGQPPIEKTVTVAVEVSAQ